MIKAVFYFEGEEVLINEDKTNEVRVDFRPGVYISDYDQKGRIIVKEKKINEFFNPHYTSAATTILKYVDKFTEEGVHNEMKDMGFIHKLGVFLFSKPGCGKSSLINYLCKNLIESQNAIVLRVEGGSYLGSVIDLANMIREIQDNLIVLVLDEIDEYAEKYESRLKHFTDGHSSVDNCIFLAATNYPSRVPDTLLRPSRFKIIEEMKGVEDVSVIESIVNPLVEKSRLDWSKEELIEFCANLKENTVDEIKTAVQDKVMDLRLEVKHHNIGFKKEEKIEEDNYETFKKLLDRYEEEYGIDVDFEPDFETRI